MNTHLLKTYPQWWKKCGKHLFFVNNKGVRSIKKVYFLIFKENKSKDLSTKQVNFSVDKWKSK